MSKYNSPTRLYEARYSTTSTGVPVLSRLDCGHNPFLVARLAHSVHLYTAKDEVVLEWTEPDTIVIGKDTTISRGPGARKQAPIRLPLRLYPDNNSTLLIKVLVVESPDKTSCDP